MTINLGQEFTLVCDDQIVKTFSFNEYCKALEAAAQLDFEMNSAELNDGVAGNHIIRLV